MGLDKWIKPEGTRTEQNKKKDENEPKKRSDSKPKEKEKEKETLKLIKNVLICSNSKCKYKKTIVKKLLTEKDLVCPRCKNEMRLK